MSDRHDHGQVPLVDWEAAGRRLLRTGAVLAVAVLVVWVGWSLFAAGFDLVVLGNLVGAALLGMFAVELWVAGGSALRGMLRAGERGDRLAGEDVGLLPPQLRRGGSIRPAVATALEDAASDDESSDEDDDRPDDALAG